VLKRAFAVDGNVDPATEERLRDLTVELVAHIRQEIGIVEFWQKVSAVQQLRTYVFEKLDDTDLFPFEELDHAADVIMDLANHNRGKLLR
jgi:type I restriction enzyme R subunit